MIKRIYVSELDRHNLSKYKTEEGEARDYFDYKNIVVKKPWGYEYLMFENDYVAIWILHLKMGHGTSMHCHPQKKSSLIVLSGKAQSTTLSEWFDLGELDGLIIENGVFHSTKALTNDVFVMEIETPPNKKDLVRLKDSYGREGKGYEAENKMSHELNKYKHVFFDKKNIIKKEKKKINKAILQLWRCQSTSLESEIKKSNKKIIYSLLEEKIISSEDKEIFGTGSIFLANNIDEKSKIRMYNNCLMLTIELSR